MLGPAGHRHPLAIELAAARVRAFGVGEIAARLDDRLLTGTSATANPRHQTLRAVTDWSYTLLSDAERAVFRRFAVFAGGWTLSAAEAVCLARGDAAADLPDLLMRLVDKVRTVTPKHRPAGSPSQPGGPPKNDPGHGEGGGD